jgi:hypothetical protein
MDLVERLNILIWAWIQSLRSVKKVSIFFPFFLFAILQVIILALFIFFYLPPVSLFMIPLIRWFSGEAVLHYPQLYIALPRLFSIMNAWLLNLFISWLFVGIATLLFAARYQGVKLSMGKAFSRALRRAGPLFLVGLVEWIVVKIIMELLGLFSTNIMNWGIQSPRLLIVLGFFLNIILLTPFAFTAAEVLLAGRGIGGALRGSFGLARRNFGVTYLIFALPSLFPLLVRILLIGTPRIVSEFHPNVVVLLLLLSIVITLVINFVIVGALTALYLRATQGVEMR